MVIGLCFRVLKMRRHPGRAFECQGIKDRPHVLIDNHGHPSHYKNFQLFECFHLILYSSMILWAKGRHPTMILVYIRIILVLNRHRIRLHFQIREIHNN